MTIDVATPPLRTVVGTVSRIDAPVHCGWLRVVPQTLHRPVSFEPHTAFVPFALMKNGRVIARVIELTGPTWERIAAPQTISGPGRSLCGPLVDFLGWLSTTSRAPTVGDEFEYQLKGAVFREGDPVAVIGSVIGHLEVGTRRVPVISADAIGIGQRGLRHAREVMLGLGH